jgi:hypothetical protein
LTSGALQLGHEEQWQAAQVEDGASLGLEEELYDIPPSLFDRLGSELGPAAAPEVRAAELPAQLGVPWCRG